jgi:hypothetical protein
VCEAGLLLVRADLGVTGEAPLAPSAPADEGNGHPVTDGPAAHPFPDLRDDAGELVARDVGEGDVVVPGPGVPVASAHPGRQDLDHHAAGWRGGRRHLSDVWLGTDGIDDYGSHRRIIAGGADGGRGRIPGRMSRRCHTSPAPLVTTSGAPTPTNAVRRHTDAGTGTHQSKGVDHEDDELP